MDVTSSPPNTTDYIYVYDEDTSPCSEGNGFSKFRSLFLPIFYCLVFVSCLMGNTLVLWVLITRKKITTMTDMCLLNLAISDLLFVLPLPFQAHYASDNWIFGNAVCKIMAGIYYMGFYSSIFFITLMSIDRYIAIVHIVNARKIRTATWGVLISLVLWLVAGFASVPNMVFSKEVVIEQSVECVPDYPPGQETWRIFTHFGINLLGLVFPLGILIYCYSRILINLQCVRVKNRNKIKAIRMIFIIVICFFIFWTPFNIVLFLDSLQIMHIINECKTSHNLALALQLTETISFIHCCLNPVIYAFAGEIFKAHIKKLFQSWIHVIQNTSSADSSSLFNSWHTQVRSNSESDRVL
ncbi:PREDICTED: C-C chemokine receptor type 8-like [Crocodylus porosus]|uniref:C-C chemokine receptor type 8-like n=1 Tax=Crocodylus porosus TaxID=8502 RepID=UPI00093B7F38|nr:PREDICTED: C-C chemokine receptor type 8-like [Crocodylus porosus]